jgi:hypothetical protein
MLWTALSAVFGFIRHLQRLRRKPTAPKPPASKPMATTPPPSPKFADIIEDRFRFLDEVVKAEAASHKDLGGL